MAAHNASLQGAPQAPAPPALPVQAPALGSSAAAASSSLSPPPQASPPPAPPSKAKAQAKGKAPAEARARRPALPLTKQGTVSVP